MSLRESSVAEACRISLECVLLHLLNHLGVFWLISFLPFLKAFLICGKIITFVFSFDTKQI